MPVEKESIPIEPIEQEKERIFKILKKEAEERLAAYKKSETADEGTDQEMELEYHFRNAWDEWLYPLRRVKNLEGKISDIRRRKSESMYTRHLPPSSLEEKLHDELKEADIKKEEFFKNQIPYIYAEAQRRWKEAGNVKEFENLDAQLYDLLEEGIYSELVRKVE